MDTGKGYFEFVTPDKAEAVRKNKSHAGSTQSDWAAHKLAEIRARSARGWEERG